MTWAQQVVRDLAYAVIVLGIGGPLLYSLGFVDINVATASGLVALGLWLGAGWMWLCDPDTVIDPTVGML